MIQSFFRGSRNSILFRVGLLVVLVAAADWRVDANVPLGFLYLLPMSLAGGVLSRKQIVLLAVGCTVLAEAFDSFAWSPQLGVPRDVLYFSAFAGIGLFVYEVVSNRRAASRHLEQVENESRARREAEEQLKILIESSPVAIFTADSEGVVLSANDAAHRLFGLKGGALPGRSINRHLPSLISVPALRSGRQSFRTVMQCRGYRQDGEMFIADVWFSTYSTSSGSRLAAIVVDASEELRDREETGLHQLLTGSRILVGAVSHEIRNVCGAIAVVHENLSRGGALAGSKDFEALGTLVLALEKIASMDLRQVRNDVVSVDLRSLLEELMIIVGPELREAEIDIHWEIEANLPAVWADRQSLMQVFLNLVKNSERAIADQAERVARADQAERSLRLFATMENQRVRVVVQDTGCGVAHPELLFRPFQPQAQATGLGVYLSRALMRSFHGDLRYQESAKGARFVIELAPVPNPIGEAHGKETQTIAG